MNYVCNLLIINSLIAREDGSEMVRQTRFDVLGLDRTAEQTLERRDPAVRDAARNDQIEIVEIGRDVEREPVAGDPARDADPNGRELFAPDPHTGQAVHASRIDAVVGGRANEHLL